MIGYNLGYEHQVGWQIDLVPLSEFLLFLNDYLTEVKEDTVLLAGEINYDSQTSVVLRVADWDELNLPYSLDDLIEAKELERKALETYSEYGNIIYDEDFVIEVTDTVGYPNGDYIFGDAVAGYLGADIDQTTIDRFLFYANYE